jgi:hypothetical protein
MLIFITSQVNCFNFLRYIHQLNNKNNFMIKNNESTNTDNSNISFNKNNSNNDNNNNNSLYFIHSVNSLCAILYSCSSSTTTQTYLWCQFHQHFTRAAFCTKVSCQGFLCLHFMFKLFLAQENWRKWPYKMLAKLTTAFQNPHHVLPQIFFPSLFFFSDKVTREGEKFPPHN